MSKINNQTQDLYSIEAVQDLSHEAAATISGGSLDLSDLRDGEGQRRSIVNPQRSFETFNNKASWYEVTPGSRDWIVYTGQNFTGDSRRLQAGTKGNLTGPFNNTIASARPA